MSVGGFTKRGQIKREIPPKPEYDKCNAGHTLVPVWDEARQRYSWDCPTCIAKMKAAREKGV